MLGVLFDVSGSMEKAFALHYDKRSAITDDRVTRSHGIITTLNKLVSKEVVSVRPADQIFASAFGLKSSACEGVVTCDLVSMLENKYDLESFQSELRKWEKDFQMKSDAEIRRIEDGGYESLIQFSKINDASHMEPWIKRNLTKMQAAMLYDVLRKNPVATNKLKKLIPYNITYTVYQLFKGEGADHEGNEASEFALRLINGRNIKDVAKYNKGIQSHIAKKPTLTILRDNEKPKPRSIKEVSILLDHTLQENRPSSSRVHEIISSLKPYIYGRTPMVKALRDAKEIFNENNPKDNPNILFILSDGNSTDGDPLEVTKELQRNITIFTCYFTSEPIPYPKRLYNIEDPSWSDGARVMFNMSSTATNADSRISHLIDYGWELPPSGECHLFVQANSLDVVEEFCGVVSPLMYSTDALVHILGKVSLGTYINQSNENFKAPQQRYATCYANAIAAVFHLAMNRIAGREGGIPTFEQIRDSIIQEHGKTGNNTKMVLEKVCPEYGLKLCEVDEIGARQAIHKRRPVVAKFYWKDKQQKAFEDYFKKCKKGILNAKDIPCEGNYFFLFTLLASMYLHTYV